MPSELDFTNYIQNRLEAVDIFSETQSTCNLEIDGALKTASKSQSGKRGYPDHIALVKDFVLVMEDKSDRLKLVLRDGGEISQSVDATTNYAINGALFYAKKIFDATPYKKIFAFGNVGDRKHHIIRPVFFDGEIIKELPEVDTFKNFTAENIDAYWRRMVLGETSPEEIELKKILRNAETLHEYLRNYGALGETEKPLVVSAILLALAEKNFGFDVSQLTGDKIKTDGAKIFENVENHLRRANVRPDVKKEQVLDQFRLIKNRPQLNVKKPALDKTPLRFFTEFVEKHIFDAVVNNSSEDYLGRFYGEFISYSGGDGQSLGVVLTPRHITELFCELVDLKPDDIVFDPCCGTGGFLIAAMNHMLKLSDSEEQRKLIKQNQLFGIDNREDMFSIATTNMILRGDGKSNLTCGDFFAHDAGKLQLNGFTVGFMNPPYSQAKNAATAHLSELNFIRHLLNSITRGGRVAVIVPVSAMIGKNRDDKRVKADILRGHTLEGVISLNKDTFYGIGTVPCIAVFTAGEPHNKNKRVKFVNFEDDGFIVKKHVGLVETERAKDRKSFLLDCWRGKIPDAPSKFIVETTIDAADEWLHSFYYYNDELPADIDFSNTVADYLTFEFNMIAHGRGYLFADKKKRNVTLNPDSEPPPPLTSKRWQEFLIENIFSISSGKRLTKADMIAGNVPFIGASDSNNGVTAFVGNENISADKNVLGVNYNGSVVENFYHPYHCIFSDDVKRFKLKNFDGNEFIYLFMKTIILQQKNKFTYGYKFNETRMRRQKILLPVTDDGAPDFDFMEKYIRAEEEKILRRYRDYVRELESEPPPPPAEKIWKTFNLSEIFSIRATSSGIDKNKLIAGDGNFPYVTRTDRNNGIQDFICEQPNYKRDEKNCITVGLDTQTVFYQTNDFYTGQNIQVLTNEHLNFHVAQFLLPLLKNTLSIFSWGGNGATLTRLRRSKILLPVNEAGEPDFEYMEKYIRAEEGRILRRYLAFR